MDEEVPDSLPENLPMTRRLDVGDTVVINSGGEVFLTYLGPTRDDSSMGNFVYEYDYGLERVVLPLIAVVPYAG